MQQALPPAPSVATSGSFFGADGTNGMLMTPRHRRPSAR
jgi:hypothetical protein